MGKLKQTVAVLAIVWSAWAQPARAPLRLRAPVSDKNFYLLTSMESTATVERAIRTQPDLMKLAETRHDALSKAAAACVLDVACYVEALKFTDAEIAGVTSALQGLYAGNTGIRRWADGPLTASGAFVRYQSKGGSAMLAAAWSDAAKGVNAILEVYGLGHAPRYPAIDSVSYDVKSEAYGRLVRTVALVAAEDSAHLRLFFQPSLHFALGLLEANHRDEAGRLEPLETGENRAALRRVRTVRWNRFPYSVIVVPGSGTDTEAVTLSAWGKLRLTLAARRYHEGKAPFLLVSGGFVHPKQTAHCEAMEMKRSLMADYGIPENAILIDPHARHTTTNLRNAARQLYRYGFPVGKIGLITSDQDQSASIVSAAFATRCLRELGYQPVLSLQRVSQFDVSFLPNIESLQFDARDPLDP